MEDHKDRVSNVM